MGSRRGPRAQDARLASSMGALSRWGRPSSLPRPTTSRLELLHRQRGRPRDSVFGCGDRGRSCGYALSNSP